jgi:hypothetical protein
MKTFWTPEADFKVIVVVGGNENPHSEAACGVFLQRKEHLGMVACTTT